MKPERRSVFFVILFCAFASVLYAKTNLVSKPAGVLRITILPNEQKLVSMPLNAFDNSVDSIFTNQIPSGVVTKWSGLRYDQAFKASDEKFYSDLTNRVPQADQPVADMIPSDMTIQPGEGFFLESVQAAGTTQSVFLVGKIILDETNTMILAPGPNLIGYPFSGLPCEVSQRSMGAPSQDIPVPELGEGYWLNNTSSVATVWSEIRPYAADVFPTDEIPPQISGIAIKDGKDAVLTIETAGVDGEKLDIFYKDLTPTSRLETACGWLVADENIPVATGQKTLEWVDSGSVNRVPVSKVFARYFILARTDVDLNANGISDAREQFVLGRDLSVQAEVSGQSPTPGGYGEPRTAAVSNLLSGSPVFPVSASSLSARVIWVDRGIGADHLSGKTEVVVGSDGPRKSIKAGLDKISGERKTLVIKSGTYGENLNITGRDVKVVIRGKVDLRGRRQKVETPVLPPAQSNFVNIVTNTLETIP